MSITEDKDKLRNTVNQSKLEVTACIRTNNDWFGFNSDWMKKWRDIFKPIKLRSNTNQLLFATKMKSNTELALSQLLTVFS